MRAVLRRGFLLPQPHVSIVFGDRGYPQAPPHGLADGGRRDRLLEQRLGVRTRCYTDRSVTTPAGRLSAAARGSRGHLSGGTENPPRNRLPRPSIHAAFRSLPGRYRKQMFFGGTPHL